LLELREDGMKLLTPENVAESLSVSRSTVLRMISDGSLPAVCLRRGKRKAVYRIREEVLERWVVSKERQGVKTERKPSTPARPSSGGNEKGQDFTRAVYTDLSASENH